LFYLAAQHSVCTSGGNCCCLGLTAAAILSAPHGPRPPGRGP